MNSAIYFDALGYFCLGIFVGTITSHAINFATDAKTSFNAIGIVLPAALGGVAMTFLQSMGKAPHGMPAYAIGLLIGLMWVRARIAIDNLDSRAPEKYLLGWAHMIAVITASVLAFSSFVPDGYRFDLNDQSDQNTKIPNSNSAK